MKRVFPQESAADSHSLISNGFQPGALGGSRRVQTSAAMLGIALSFGTSASLLVEPESALAAEGSIVAVLPAASSQTLPVRPVVFTDQGELATTAYHTVEEGDSLWHIAEEHQADVDSIKTANGIAPDEVLRVGQVIRVPAVNDTELVAKLPGEVHRLALSGNVRGSVGGDLSVVFGEELPEVSSPDEREPVAEPASKFDDGAIETASAASELTAAHLLDINADEPAVVRPTLDQATVAALPTSLPLNEVAAEPLNEISSDAAEDAPVDAASATFEASVPETHAATVTPDIASVTFEASTPETPAAAITPAAVAPTTADLETAVNSWQDQDIQIQSAEAPEVATHQSLRMAAQTQPVVEATPEPEFGISVPPESSRVYRVKSGDTFWNIASRHGLSAEDLRRHNAGIQKPEELAVGDNINIPLHTGGLAAADSSEPGPRASVLPSGDNREAAIRDHVARIRAAANRDIDQEALKARIIAVRQSLENAETRAATGVAPLEYHGTTTDQGKGGPVAETEQISFNLAADRAAPVSRDQWTVTDAADDVDRTDVAALPVTSQSSETLTEPIVSPTPSQDLLAVAPMNPDVYRASPQLPIGEVVTPGMPILPESGEFLPEAPNRFNGYNWPAQGTLTSGYGWRWGRMHQGIDIAGPVGTPVMAAAPGVVVRSGWNSGGYGNLVDIRHADGSLTRYAHNSRLLVREGQQVSQGEQIAEMGSTGYSTGPHLHFEVHLPNSGTVNPMAYLPGR